MSNFLDGIKDINCSDVMGISTIKEVDITGQLDNSTRDCINSIVELLGDVKVIRCTGKSLVSWQRDTLFIEIITDTLHDNAHENVYEIIENLFGESTIEPVSIAIVTPTDTNITISNCEMFDKYEYYILYRRV